MMKKVLFVLVSLLLISSVCFALESGPSNKVGYVKIQCNGATAGVAYATPFGLPFKFWDVPTGTNVPTYGTESRKPSRILGTQTACGTNSITADRVTRQDGGEFAYRSGTACNWGGTLESAADHMEPGRAYWYANKTGAIRYLVLAGEADTTAAGIPTVTVVGGAARYTPYSWRDPRDRHVSTLNLLAQGFQGGTTINSDRVYAQLGGASAYYRTSDATWQGTLGGASSGGGYVNPGAAYWILSKHASSTWAYTYNASGVPIVMPTSRVNVTPGVIQVVKPTPNVQAPATTKVRATHSTATVTNK
jgi:hypothetical protein